MAHMDMSKHMTPEQWVLASASFEQQTVSRLREAGVPDEEIAKHLARDDLGNYSHPVTAMRWPEFVMGAMHAEALHAAVQMRYVCYRQFIETLIVAVRDGEDKMNEGQKAIVAALEAIPEDDPSFNIDTFDALLAKAIYGTMQDPSGIAAAPGVLATVQPANEKKWEHMEEPEGRTGHE